MRATTRPGDTETSRVLAECRTLPWREGLDRMIRTTLEFLRESEDYRALLRTMRFPGLTKGYLATYLP